jgi:hypothetical protein
VNACGKVWKLNSGDAALSPDGKLVVDLHGLVLNDASVGQFNGTREEGYSNLLGGEASSFRCDRHLAILPADSPDRDRRRRATRVAVRMHEAGLIKSSPRKLIAEHTDWRSSLFPTRS